MLEPVEEIIIAVLLILYLPNKTQQEQQAWMDVTKPSHMLRTGVCNPPGTWARRVCVCV